MKLWSTGILLLCFAWPAWADEAPAYDRVSLTVTAEEPVANDLLVAELFAQAEGQDSAALAADVNARVSWAIEKAMAVEAVKVQTLEYATQPVYRNNRVDGWRVTQALRLESADSDALSALVGLLQERLSVRALRYEVSPVRRQAAEDELISRAIGDFRNRAQRIAEAFGKPAYRIVDVRVTTGAYMPTPYYAARGPVVAEAAAAPPPAFESGTQDLQVEVSGTVELQ